MPSNVSIIIPVHNSLEYTKEALKRLKPALERAENPLWQFHIIVVDDGSQDGTAEWIKKHHPEIHLCYGDSNLWWSGAINTGMRYAMDKLKSDYLIWWNNDIYPAEDYFAALTPLLSETKKPTVFGSKIFTASHQDMVWSYGGYFHHRWGHSFMAGNNCKDQPEFEVPRKADWLPGMGTVLPKQVIQHIGMVNEKEFPQYHGDIDHTYRAKLAGFAVEVRPELKIWNNTEHSGISHEGKLSNLMPSLRKINSIHNFRKEWLLYRKYVRNPLAYFMLAKKYAGYFVRFVFWGRR